MGGFAGLLNDDLKKHAEAEDKSNGAKSRVPVPRATEVEVEVPDEFLCPITSDIMADPVVTVTPCRGHTRITPLQRCTPLALCGRRAASPTRERP